MQISSCFGSKLALLWLCSGPVLESVWKSGKRGVQNWVAYGITGLAASASPHRTFVAISSFLVNDATSLGTSRRLICPLWEGGRYIGYLICSSSDQTWTRFDLTFAGFVDRCTVPGSYTDPDVALGHGLSHHPFHYDWIYAQMAVSVPPRSLSRTLRLDHISSES